MDPLANAALVKGAPKLLDMVGRAIGKWYEPHHVRRLADAKAYEKLTLGRAVAQAKVESKAILEIDPLSDAVTEEVPILKRAADRIKHQEARRQENLETIIDIAEKAIPDEVSSAPVDDTWANRFFAAAADVSHDQMREVWGKILAAEVAEPGSYSLRALEILRNMSTNEALTFQKFCSFLLGLGAEVVYKTDLSGGFDQCGLSFNDILVLRAAGLVSDSDMLTTSLQIPAYFTYSGKFLLAQRMEEVSAGAQSIPYPLETYVLTPVGKELSRLVEREPNWAYVQQLAAYWKNSKRISLHVAHGFLAHSNGTASWRLLEGIPPHDQQANWVPSAGPIESPIKEV